MQVGGWRVTYGVGLTKPYADVVWASEMPPSAMLGKWAKPTIYHSTYGSTEPSHIWTIPRCPLR